MFDDFLRLPAAAQTSRSRVVVVVITRVFRTITIVLYRGFSSKVSRAVRSGRPVVVNFSSPGDHLPLSIDRRSDRTYDRSRREAPDRTKHGSTPI